jgi:hypothetical protein
MSDQPAGSWTDDGQASPRGSDAATLHLLKSITGGSNADNTQAYDRSNSLSTTRVVSTK